MVYPAVDIWDGNGFGYLRGNGFSPLWTFEVTRGGGGTFPKLVFELGGGGMIFPAEKIWVGG